MRHLNNNPTANCRKVHNMPFIHAEYGSTISRHTYAYNNHINSYNKDTMNNEIRLQKQQTLLSNKEKDA